ncbi:Hypothetical predicted protein [Paramuricea clavata]|uniref:ESF1 RRM domain-containing protein n=1 Tax=Paramuricea clavata TaxID=317549 RepID=A0A6S7FP29_PARCT|nr:Hypothetical predicted protein [Paramuricea clavata]
MEMDERFSHIAKDPRFKKIPNKKKKVKIDSRFQQMFNDENFNTKYFVDKRGRKVKESANEDLSNFYELSDEVDKITEVNKDKIVNREESSDSDDDGKVVSKKRKKRKTKKEKSTSDDKRKRRREMEENEMEDELPDDLEVLSEENDVISNIESEADNWQDFDADAPTTENSTRRLAICNMDWDKITANDLFVLLQSFVPSGGSINSVKIYPSDFGLERMEREDEIGPTELVSVEEDNGSKDQEEEYNKEKLRQYQLNRLKYYYAVVECDSPETGEKIYEECDGMEYEASSSHLDLRFIPEDMTFDREPTSQATEMPSAESYEPSEFITTALQQSTVQLTWDETDPRRVQTTMKNFSKDDILDMDFKAYLASSSDEESDGEIEETGNKKENEDRQIAKYKNIRRGLDSARGKGQEADQFSSDVGTKIRTVQNILIAAGYYVEF